MTPKLRELAHLYGRRYSSFSKLGKKAEEAVKKAKEAAEDLKVGADAAEAAERLKRQAAAASSVLGDTLSQAGALGKATMEELFKSGVAPAQGAEGAGASAAGTAAAGDHHQQQQQQQQAAGEQQSESASSSSSSAKASRPGLGDRLRGAVSAAFTEMRAAVLPESPKASALRGASAKASDIATSDATSLAVAPSSEETAWQRQWRGASDTLRGHPFFRRVASGLRDSRVVRAGGDVADSLRERWETSDSTLVHRLQDAADSMFAESEAAQALREIRARDPGFDMVEFLRLLRADVPLLIRAYLTGDEGAIREHCSPEMVERLTGIMAAQRAAGLVPDPTLLDTSEVELVDLKMLEGAPVVVTQFTCQQINCTRDGHGNVVEGAPDEVHRVYYYWAVQQEAAGYVGADGRAHPPRWQLREMMVRGMHALL